MLAVQRECKFGMINRGGLPTVGCMTSRALRSQLTGVGIIVHMARDTILRRAFELTVDMATRASNSVVRPVQFEGELGVIDRGRLPTVGRVTSRALRSQLTGVGIIVCMAGSAVLRRAFELTIDMAVRASHSIMQSI